MNDARVYALESRITQNEDMRIKEFDFMKDLMKKLVYSLEELSVKHLDDRKQELINLPRLLSQSPPRQVQSGSMTDRAIKKPDNSSTEVMMVKRMNYIRTTLDKHDPREVTEIFRQNANNNREKRIAELWREEIVKPDVEELVRKLKLEHEQQPRNDFPPAIMPEDKSTVSIVE